MKKIYLFIFTITLAAIISSCSEEFLDIKAKGSFDESILSSEEGIRALLIGAYATLNDGNAHNPSLNIASIRAGDLYKGSDPGDQPAMLEASVMQWSTGGRYVERPWRDYFNAIDRCNVVLKLLPGVEDMTEAQKTQAEAEARFLRGHYYFWLVRFYFHVPWIDETSTTYKVPNTVDNDGSTWVNNWPNIAADFDFARQNLPVTQTELARPNKWAADIYYAKIQMYRASFPEGDNPNGFNEALPILTNAIDNGVTINGLPYGLLDNYHDVFDAEYDNSMESVWAVQHSVNDYEIGGRRNGNSTNRYGGMNNVAAPSSGRGWGFYVPTPYSMDRYRVDANGLPYLDMFETNATRLKTDYGEDGAPALPAVDPFVIDANPVDPRLDWNCSRRNVPCLDYGNFPGRNWLRNQDHAGPYGSKKWYVWKSQVGIYTEAPKGSAQAINICFIRFADVLLLAAECEARVGSLDNARDYVNQVRDRMVQNSESPRNWVKKINVPADAGLETIFDDWTTEHAANYDISVYPTGGALDPFQAQGTALDAILFERLLELHMEGHSYFDLLRYGKAEEVLNDFIEWETANFDFLLGAVFTMTPDSYMPIPQTAVDNSLEGGALTLTQNPGY